MTDLFTLAALELVAASFGVGIVVGLTGMGGGALLTPALIFLGISPTTAVANNLVAAAISRTVGAAAHWRGGGAHGGIVKTLVISSVPAALAGSLGVKWIHADPAVWLKPVIGATLIIAALLYLVRLYVTMVRRPARARGEVPVRVAPTVLVGAAGGLLVGVTSVGSGSVMMVALLLLYPGLGLRRLVGTDMVQAIPLTVAAAIGQVVVNGVQWAVLIPLIVGSTPGTYLGSRLATRVPVGVIRRGIVLVLSLTGLALLGVPAAAVGVIGAGLVILGPVVWALLRDAVRRRIARADG